MVPAKQASINLLGRDDLEHTPWGRIITWAVTYGRYIMIGTEVIVLLAFVSRFSLDRKLTDLNEEIAQKQAIIEANADFEKDIRTLQEQLTKAKTLITAQAKPVDVLSDMQTMLPADVYLESFEIANNKVTVNAVAATTQGFSQFLANLSASKNFTDLEIGNVTKQALIGIKFSFTAQLSGKAK
jgi:Tfp pilus assembly protein PilN